MCVRKSKSITNEITVTNYAASPFPFLPLSLHCCKHRTVSVLKDCCVSEGDAAEKALRIQDGGDGSVQVLAAQVRIPEFRFPAPMQVLDVLLNL